MALGTLESDVMQVCWRSDEPVSVRDVLTSLNEGRTGPLAYTTVMTVMVRLVDKGILNRARRGRGHVYLPQVADEADIAVRDVLRAHGAAAVTHFAEHIAVDPDVRARLLRLLDGAE